MKKTMKKRIKWSLILAVAAVSALLETTTAFCAAGWQEENGIWKYEDNNGGYETNTWKKKGNEYLYLDENGEVSVNKIIEDGDKKHFVDSSGAMVTNTWVSMQNTDGQWEEEVSVIWLYFGSNGTAVTGKRKIDGQMYIFDDEGRMLSGWQYYTDGGGEEELYYLGEENEGYIHTGWHYLEPSEEMEAPDGGMNSYDGEEWFYFVPSSGKAYRSTRKKIDGKFYEFDANGVMKDGWQEDSEITVSIVKYYNQGTGDQPRGWVYAPGPDDPEGDRYFYYFDNSGVPFNQDGSASGGVGIKYPEVEEPDEPQSGMALLQVSGKIYLFNNEGQMQTGLYELTDVPHGGTLRTGLYYFEDEDEVTVGEQQSGKRTFKEGDTEYCFNFRNNGSAYKNWIKDGILYGPDGYQIKEEGFYTLTEETGVDNSKKKLPAGTVVVVKDNGELKKDGTARDEERRKWEVKRYVATPLR